MYGSPLSTDANTSLNSSALPERNAIPRTERHQHADEVFLARCDQRDDRRARAHAQNPPNRVGDRKIGGLADDDEIGLFQRGDARELAPGVRLGDHVEALRVQNGAHSEPRELELVTDDRSPVVPCVVHRCVGYPCVGRESRHEIRHGGSLPDPATWPYYRRRAVPTVRVQKLQPED